MCSDTLALTHATFGSWQQARKSTANGPGNIAQQRLQLKIKDILYMKINPANQEQSAVKMHSQNNVFFETLVLL